MKILQFTNEEDLKILTKKLPKIEKAEDYVLAWENKQVFFDICKNNRWIWLSANQVWIEKRFFVIHTDKMQELFINPVLVKWYWQQFSSTEWCLSFANWKKWFKKRFKMIDVKFEDENAMRYEMKLTWLEAIVFQHELDHMNWIII